VTVKTLAALPNILKIVPHSVRFFQLEVCLRFSSPRKTNDDVQAVWKFRVNSLFRNVAGYTGDSAHTLVSRFDLHMPDCEFLWNHGPMKETQLKYSLAFSSELLAA
jgi:hypothetical protein